MTTETDMTAVTRGPAPGAGFRFSWTDSFLWSIRVMALFFIAWGLLGAIGLSLSGDGLSADAWKQLIVAGLAQGSMYGLLALGYSMVYGVLGFINFAHGEVFMVGAMVGFFAADAMARSIYSSAEFDTIWIDDLTITAPDGATILFPNDPVALERETWGAIKAAF